MKTSIKTLPEVARELVKSIQNGEKNCGSVVASNNYTYHAKKFDKYVSVEVENDSFELCNVYEL